MNINKVKQQLKDNVKWEVMNPDESGGQNCGILQLKQKLISEELDIKIEIGYKRSALDNRELAIKLFELALDELVK